MDSNFFSKIKKTLNKISKNDLWLLLLLAVLLNIDRLVLGEYGLMRRLDLSDAYYAKTIFFSNFWKDPINFGWNSSMLRGWPIEIGSISVQYFGVLLATILPIYYVFPVLHILIGFLVISGAFLFLKSFLGYKRETALFGGFIFLAIHYWYNESQLVTAAPLLPLLVAVTAIGKKPINFGVRCASMLLITALSFPPYVLPIMAMAHFFLLLVFNERPVFKQNLINACIFWVIFSVFHSVSIWGYWQNWDISNRALLVSGGQSLLFVDALASFINQTVLFPAVMMFALTTRKTIRPVLYAIGIIITIVILTSINQSVLYNYIIDHYPYVKKFSFFFSRFHNFIGLTIFIVSSLLFEKVITNERWDKKKTLLKGLGMLVAIELIIFEQHEIKITLVHLVCSLVILGSLFFYRQRYFQNTILTLTVLFVVLAPFRLAYSLKRENPYQGNLFIDPFTYETEMKAFRVATIMEEPWSDDFFSAQASIKGLELFEGAVTTFYSKNDARLWYDNVAVEAPSWESLGYTFKNFNNRIELIKGDFDINPDRIYNLMKLNNVVFVRSIHPIKYPGFNLVKHKTLNLLDKKTFLLRRSYKAQDHYLYQIIEPMSRAFTISDEVLNQYNSKQGQSQQKWDELELINQNSANIFLEEYKPGEIKFEGSFNEDQKILISTNYSHRWELFINGKRDQKKLVKGPLGMLQIDPLNKKANYKLHFKSNFRLIIFSMFVAIVLYLFYTLYIQSKYLSQKSNKYE
jgi:hypothetical protein